VGSRGKRPVARQGDESPDEDATSDPEASSELSQEPIAVRQHTRTSARGSDPAIANGR